MKVNELIAALSEFPGDADVDMEICVEAGFYDVRGKYESAPVRSVDEAWKGDGVTLR